MKTASRRSSASGKEFELTLRAARFILAKTKLRPKIGLVLGSGLGAFAHELSSPVRVPYSKIPGFPQSTVEGHSGNLVIGKVGDIPVAVMQGRVHLYEGYSIKEVTFPMRVLWQMGVRSAILTNAAGAINVGYSQGALVFIRDHINLQGVNPLTGPNDARFGPRFPDMTDAYSKEFRETAWKEAERIGIATYDGVYAALSGPSYETPAEIHYLKSIGANLVGMSTVPEVIVARHMGMRILGISCVTNMAAGVLDQPIDHADVMATGERVKAEFIKLLRAVIPAIAAHGK